MQTFAGMVAVNNFYLYLTKEKATQIINLTQL